MNSAAETSARRSFSAGRRIQPQHKTTSTACAGVTVGRPDDTLWISDPDLRLGVVMRRKPPLERLFVREGLDPARMRDDGGDGLEFTTRVTHIPRARSPLTAPAKTDLQCQRGGSYGKRHVDNDSDSEIEPGRQSSCGPSIAIVGACCLGVIALRRGEPVNAIWIVTAAIAVFLIALPLLCALHRRQGARARPEPRDAGGAAQRRPRLRAHPQMGRVRTPLRRDRRRGPAGRARCSRHRWATCRERCGSWSASCSRARCRTS